MSAGSIDHEEAARVAEIENPKAKVSGCLGNLDPRCSLIMRHKLKAAKVAVAPRELGYSQLCSLCIS